MNAEYRHQKLEEYRQKRLARELAMSAGLWKKSKPKVKPFPRAGKYDHLFTDDNPGLSDYDYRQLVREQDRKCKEATAARMVDLKKAKALRDAARTPERKKRSWGHQSIVLPGKQLNEAIFEDDI